ncbi:hypothetical protein AB0L06_19590 [Spirillospora sp. NPDC052269]
MKPRALRLRTASLGLALVPLGLAGLQPPAVADEAPVTIKSSTVTPSTIIGGSGGTQTVTLSRPAPEGGTEVRLRYDKIYEATVGNSVRVPAGQTSVTFPFRVAAPTATHTGAISAQITGSTATSSAGFTHQAADPSTRAVSTLRFNETAPVDGTPLTGTVELKYPAPSGGLTVSLWANTAYGAASMYLPSYVTVPAGAVKADFQAYAFADGPGFVKPSADLGTSLASQELVMTPKAFALSGDAPKPNSSSRLALGIGDAANPSGAVVFLKSNSPEVKVPAQVTVPAGKHAVAVPYSMGDFTQGSPWPTVTATWNGKTVTSLIFPQ